MNAEWPMEWPMRLSMRVDGALQQKISAGGSSLDSERHGMVVDGHVVELSPEKFDLLAYLMCHAERVRSRADLLKAVWGDSEYVDARTIDVHVRGRKSKRTRLTLSF